MKVLAIRGRNLASLAGDFSVEMADGPLGHAGLFAITGPTGAGKSTLLDTLCLPLYNRTPRLGGRGGKSSDTVESDVSSGDARNLLRRGAGEGFAQVDFAASDGRMYRATWRARRARNAAAGKLQEVSIELLELPMMRVRHLSRTTDTLKLIESLVGLTYDQFCRSVLLAQGDFAAFLKANQHERSELLEAMTGTEIYSEISRQAFEMAKEQRLRLEALQKSLPAMMLSDAELEGLETSIGALQSEESNFNAQLQSCEKELQWHADLARLQKDEHGAELALYDAQQSLSAIERLKAEAEEVERVQPLRGDVDALDRAQADVERAKIAIGEIRDAETHASEVLSLARETFEKAQNDVARAHKALADVAPEIVRARELDTKIAGARKLLVEDERAAAAAESAANESAQHVEKLRTDEDGVETHARSVRRWLKDNARWEKAAAQRGWVGQSLRQALTAETLAREAALSVEKLTKDLQPAQAEAAKAAKQSAAVEKELKAAEKTVALAAEEKKQAGAKSQRGAVERGRKLTSALEELIRIRSDFARCKERADQQRTAARAHIQSAEEARAEANLRADEASKLEKKVREHQEKLDWITAALSLEEHRQRLKPGEECPLCGSTEHPLAAHAGPGAKLEKEQRKKLEELQKRLKTASGAEAAALARVGEEEKQAKVASETANDHEAEATRVQEQWQSIRDTLKGTNLPRDPASVTDKALAKEHAVAQAELQIAQEAEAAAQSSAEAYTLAVSACGELQKKSSEVVQATHSAAQRVARIEAEIERANDDLIRQTKACEALCQQLAPWFDAWPDWREFFIRDGEKFIELSVREAQRFAEQQVHLGECEKRLMALHPELSAAEQSLSEKRSRQQQADDAVKNRRADVNALEKSRAQLLNGKPVAEFEAALKHDADAASEVLEKARNAHREAELGQREIGTRLKQTQAEMATHEKRAVAEEKKLAKKLEALGMDAQRLRALLQHDDRWLTERRQEIAAVQQGYSECKVRHAERQRARQAHEASARPSEHREAILQRRERVKNDLHTLRQALEKKVGLRALERDRREQFKATSHEIDAQRRKLELWEGISGLIGSKDGQKFRTFAQSLTLNILLAHANQNLKELAPRYSLERTPGTDMDLQIVDLDMGQERRAINTLSGGESFLVSLGLALGLSSMAAQRTRIESLFIDEGFGSLDADTLEAALSVLDALQAGGRQVGIISHVPGLAERIGAQVRILPRGGGRSEVKVV